jgi:Putative bacterial sensory transduction regulator
VPVAPPRAAPVPDVVEGWLRELGIDPPARHERDGAAAWDVVLDGLRRFDVKVTIILEPDTGVVVWVHYAPPIGDSRIRSYRKLLRWNDEIPFAKFALASDDRPILTAEVPLAILDREELGFGLARTLAICDLLLEESASWIWVGGRIPAAGDRVSRNRSLLSRFAERLAPLAPERR